jgi:hypothetical protein
MADRLPEMTVLDTDGRQVGVRDLARERPLILAFLRHFG